MYYYYHVTVVVDGGAAYVYYVQVLSAIVYGLRGRGIDSIVLIENEDRKNIIVWPRKNTNFS